MPAAVTDHEFDRAIDSGDFEPPGSAYNTDFNEREEEDEEVMREIEMEKRKYEHTIRDS